MDSPKHHPLEEKLGHRFADPGLLRTALTHPSLAGPGAGNNERLEFLGDAVLGFVVAAELYRRHPDAPEGELDRMRAACVNGRSLAARGRELGLDDALLVSRAEAENNPKRSRAMVENCFEAVVGALYLDAGLQRTAAFLRRVLKDGLDAAREGLAEQNPKGRLQERFQAEGRPLPSYELVSSDGPDHARRYTVEVRSDDRTLGSGEGRSKKTAESRAAEEALRRLEEDAPGEEA